MRLYHDHILPRLVHFVLGRERFSRLRRRYLGGLSGEVLEVGFGSGLNLPHLPPAITRLVALDPAGAGRTLAAAEIERAPFPMELSPCGGEEIPLPDASVDGALTTWTLCTIPRVEHALAEIRRVLKPGGRYCFIEHDRAPEAGVARWQDRLNPLQKRLGGGCHLNREIDRLIAAAGFTLGEIDRFYFEGPRVASYTYAGTATAPSGGRLPTPPPPPARSRARGRRPG